MSEEDPKLSEQLSPGTDYKCARCGNEFSSPTHTSMYAKCPKCHMHAKKVKK